jgi:hypothetical protein
MRSTSLLGIAISGNETSCKNLGIYRRRTDAPPHRANILHTTHARRGRRTFHALLTRDAACTECDMRFYCKYPARHVRHTYVQRNRQTALKDAQQMCVPYAGGTYRVLVRTPRLVCDLAKHAKESRKLAEDVRPGPRTVG